MHSGGCHRSLCSTRCRPLYGAQSCVNDLLVGLGTADLVMSSVVTQLGFMFG